MADDFLKNELLKKKWMIVGIIATLVIITVIPLSFYRAKVLFNRNSISGTDQKVDFAGRGKCKECHKIEFDRWFNSDHDRAMDIADNNTVLGDFNDSEFVHNGITRRFFKKGEKFFIHTPGPDGEFADFQVSHVFGFNPLQQYLVSFPGGRLQCLTIAWDVIKEQWYVLPNHTDDHEDWLHWTNQGQNWNGMCAECHTTNLKKGYNISTDTFNTTWSEIDVSCESCHGPGSKHVAWAEQPAMARRQTDNFDLVVKTRNIASKDLIEICARCHSRRSSIDDFSHFHKDTMDYMIPSLLTADLYYPDGQILDEVYVYGSFMQSKMFLRDVKCSDCHDVHSQELKMEGNTLCLTCHRADTYDTANHHFHKKIYKGKESDGDDCIKCHMPERTYMGIDERADHSIRIPRPDLTKQYNTPNSCNTAGCHSDKTVQWTNEYMAKWYGQKKRPHYARFLLEGRSGNLDVLPELITLANDQLFPPNVRATALSLLVSYPVEESFKALETALFDSEALVRQTAISTINQLQFDKDAKFIFPLLYDPVKAVRIQAALGVVSIKNPEFSKNQKKVLRTVIDEYTDAMTFASDFPSGRYNLGLMYSALGHSQKAIKNYENAIKIDSRFFPALNNLALLYNNTGQNKKAEVLLRQILEIYPEMHEITYSLGLLLAEEKRYQDAVIYIKKAAGGLPERPRVHYNLGLLFQLIEENNDAEKALLTALSLEPQNFDFLYALADHYLKTNNFNNALLLAQQMKELFPDNKIGFEIEKYIYRMTNK